MASKIQGCSRLSQGSIAHCGPHDEELPQSAKVCEAAPEETDGKEERLMTWPKGSPSRLPCDAKLDEIDPAEEKKKEVQRSVERKMPW